MSSEVAQRLSEHLAAVVKDAGLFLEDVLVLGAGRHTIVRAVVDLPDGPGGVDSEQLTEVSRALSAALDELDLIPGAYSLEVSTPGIDRPLTAARHFRRALSRLVRIEMGEAAVEGTLSEVGETSVCVDGREIAYDLITSARMIVDLRRTAKE